jgi:hypothetical protein
VGVIQTPTYKTWAGMIQRCTNKNRKNYKYYGGRGINVCDKWLTFEGFYDDMNDRPEGMTIDRIDNNGNYCKENCKWSTNTDQHNNTRSNINITYNGKTQTITQWSNELGININTLRYRLFYSKWSMEKSFTTIFKEG